MAVPVHLSDENFRELRSAGLQVRRTVSIWPAGLPVRRQHRTVCPMAFESFERITELLPHFIEQAYNKRWLHSALDYLSPKQYEDQHIRQTGKSAVPDPCPP